MLVINTEIESATVDRRRRARSSRGSTRSPILLVSILLIRSIRVLPSGVHGTRRLRRVLANRLRRELSAITRVLLAVGCSITSNCCISKPIVGSRRSTAMRTIVVHSIRTWTISSSCHHSGSWGWCAAISLSTLVEGVAILAIRILWSSMSAPRHAWPSCCREWASGEFIGGRGRRADSGPSGARHEWEPLSSCRVQFAQLNSIFLLFR